MSREPGRYCACGCGTPLDIEARIRRGLQPLRIDAKWASDACATRWARANPGRSKRDARPVVVGRTKPVRRSGPSVRVAARRAIDAVADELGRLGVARARARAIEIIRPLVPARYRDLIDEPARGR